MGVGEGGGGGSGSGSGSGSVPVEVEDGVEDESLESAECVQCRRRSPGVMRLLSILSSTRDSWSLVVVGVVGVGGSWWWECRCLKVLCEGCPLAPATEP